MKLLFVSFDITNVTFIRAKVPNMFEFVNGKIQKF